MHRAVPCDAALCVRGCTLEFHWSLLEGVYPLSSSLRRKLSRAQDKRVYSPHTSPAVAKSFLRYLYSGKLPRSPEILNILERKWLLSPKMEALIKAKRIALILWERQKELLQETPVRKVEEFPPVATLQPLNAKEELVLGVGNYYMEGRRSLLCKKSNWLARKLQEHDGVFHDLTFPDERANAFLREYIRMLQEEEPLCEEELLLHLNRKSATFLRPLWQCDGILQNYVTLFESEPEELDILIDLERALPVGEPFPERSKPQPDLTLKLLDGTLSINRQQLALRSALFRNLDEEDLTHLSLLPKKFVRRWQKLLIEGRWDNSDRRQEDRPPLPYGAAVALLPTINQAALFALLQKEDGYPYCYAWFGGEDQAPVFIERGEELLLREKEIPFIFKEHFKATPTLRHFSLHLSPLNRNELILPFYKLLQGCLKLRSLKLTGASWAGAPLFALLAECCRELEELEINCLVGQHSARDLLILTKGCRSLRTLRVPALGNLDWEETAEALEKLVEIEELDLHLLKGKGTLSAKLLKKLLPLKVLSLTGNHGVDAPGWCHLLAHTPHLTVLRLEVKKITAALIRKIPLLCPRLVELHLEGHEVDRAFLRNLAYLRIYSDRAGVVDLGPKPVPPPAHP